MRESARSGLAGQGQVPLMQDPPSSAGTGASFVWWRQRCAPRRANGCSTARAFPVTRSCKSSRILQVSKRQGDRPPPWGTVHRPTL